MRIFKITLILLVVIFTLPIKVQAQMPVGTNFWFIYPNGVQRRMECFQEFTLSTSKAIAIISLRSLLKENKGRGTLNNNYLNLLPIDSP